MDTKDNTPKEKTVFSRLKSVRDKIAPVMSVYVYDTIADYIEDGLERDIGESVPPITDAAGFVSLMKALIWTGDDELAEIVTFTPHAIHAITSSIDEFITHNTRKGVK